MFAWFASFGSWSRSLAIGGFFALLVSTPCVASLPAPFLDPSLATLDPDGRIGWLDPASKHVEGEGPWLLNLAIPQRGWLLVEVEAPDLGDPPLWFDLVEGLPSSTEQGRVAHGHFVERDFERGLLAVEPGSLALRVGTVTPHPDASLKLVTHFVPAGVHEIPKDGEEGDDTETHQVEILPNEEEAPDTPREKEGTDEDGYDPYDKDGEEGDDTETHQVEILPVYGDSTDPWWNCLAGNEPFDDFGLCATALEPGVRVEKRLGELRVEDRDYFAFRLDTTARVELTTDGGLGTRTVLLHRGGKTLAEVEQGDLSGTPQLVAHLVPGDYLVRVEGLGATVGDYGVELRTEALVAETLIGSGLTGGF